MHLGSGNSGVSAHSRNYDILCVRGGNWT